MNVEEILQATNRLLCELTCFLSSEEVVRLGGERAANLAARAHTQCAAITLALSKWSTYYKQNYNHKPDNYVPMDIKNEDETPADYIETDNINNLEEKTVIEEENYDVPSIILTEPDNTQIKTQPNNSNECPYNLSPITQVTDNATKSGILYRKAFFKKLYNAVLIDHWLLIYNAKKDKPFQHIDVIDRRAREKRKPTFELYGEGKKSLEFIAANPTEMEQWINVFNSTDTKISTPRKSTPEPILPTANSEEEIYSSINEPQSDTHLRPKTRYSLDGNPCIAPELPPRSAKLSPRIIRKDDYSNQTANYVNLEETQEIYEELDEDKTKTNNQEEKITEPQDITEITIDKQPSKANTKFRPFANFGKKNKCKKADKKREKKDDKKSKIKEESKENKLDNEIIEEIEEAIYNELEDLPKPVESFPEKNTQNESDIVEEEEEDIYDELGNFSNEIEPPNNILTENDIPEEEEEIYDEIGNYDPTTFSTTPETKPDELDDEDLIYDDLSSFPDPNIQQPITAQEENHREVQNGVLTKENDDLKSSNKDEKDTRSSVLSKVSLLQKELMKNTSPIKEGLKKPEPAKKTFKTATISPRPMVNRRDIVAIENNTDKESPKQLLSLIQQMERNLSFNK